MGKQHGIIFIRSREAQIFPWMKPGFPWPGGPGEALKDVNFDLCFSSPLLRARQTAEAVLGERKIPMILDKRIQEIDFGVLEGVVWLDKDGHAISKEMEVFFNDPVHFQKPKGGESLEDVLARTGISGWKKQVIRSFPIKPFLFLLMDVQ